MLKRVSIQNFKSLKDITLDLQKVNLLIGPNNSGKTNFLKALARCDSLIRDSNDEDQKGLFSKYGTSDKGDMFGKLYTEDLSLHLIFDKKPFEEIDGKYTHIIYKYLAAPFNTGTYILRYGISKEMEINVQYVEFPSTRNSMHDFFGIGAIYKPDPNKFTQPANFSADSVELIGDCSNLISFLFHLNTNHKRAYQQIEKDLANCVGDIVSFSTPPVKVGADSKLGLKFFGKDDEDYWADEVSEGVLYFLALLTIVNQPNPPKLLLLEEPEKGVHPRRIREVMNLIRRLVSEKDIQVIMTTHSPILLDEFAESTESVFVFDKNEEGATIIRNLQRDIIEPTNQENERLGIPPVPYTEALGEYWTIGFLGGIPHETA